MYNILAYGAVKNRKFDSTAAFRSAVDACRAAGGGTVVIPDGEYTIASVRLYSNIHLLFEPGAYVYGSEDPDKFEPRENLGYPLYQDASHSCIRHSMFWAEGCENITVSGAGTIDMQSVWEKRDTPGEGQWTARRAAKIFGFRECRSVTVMDMTLLHATDLAVYFLGCEHVRVSGLKLDVNIDGISPDCCRDVVISDCKIRSGDDGIVLKSSYALNRREFCKDVTVKNCVVSSRCNAIKLGTESNGGFQNIHISNCEIHDTYYAGVSLEITDGGDMDGVTVTDLKMRNVGYPLFVILSDRRRGPAGTTIGSMKNIEISRITAVGPYEPFKAPQLTALWEGEQMDMPCLMPSSVTGQPGVPIENISLADLNFTVPGGGTEADRDMVVPEITHEYPENDRFGETLPAYGIYFRHMKGLHLKNIDIRPIQEDKREMLVFEDVEMRQEE
ncbi:MAG: right-handed parallel beta-helix repeat-containing protein [Lachnospiraceae bacterium]|nr:right-handed parallel beta-helix repeat-containing protein [Lachnospiraceae bacterium]